eukprot:4294235-Prymnesium_polylepis.1
MPSARLLGIGGRSVVPNGVGGHAATSSTFIDSNDSTYRSALKDRPHGRPQVAAPDHQPALADHRRLGEAGRAQVAAGRGASGHVSHQPVLGALPLRHERDRRATRGEAARTTHRHATRAVRRRRVRRRAPRIATPRAR